MKKESEMTIHELASLAGITRRALHHYDEIGLLHPSRTGENGYRFYDDDAALRLQQILFYKELGMDLGQIMDILTEPGFDINQALESHKLQLLNKIERLQRLIGTVEETQKELKGGKPMNKQKMFGEFNEEKQKEYEKEVRQKYGEHAFDGVHDWKSYSKAQQQQIIDEGNQVYEDLVKVIDLPVSDQKVQAIISRWHQHMKYFYDPSIDRMRGLANLYNDSPDFKTKFDSNHPQLAEYMREAINFYCDRLENK
jgi:DNA-binding transcriptional MerR regulator